MRLSVYPASAGNLGILSVFVCVSLWLIGILFLIYQEKNNDIQ